MKKALFFLAAFLLLSSCGEESMLRARGGVLDFKNQPFPESGRARLRGGWRFAVGKTLAETERALQHSRSRWQPGYLWYWQNPRRIPSGYALFRLELQGASPQIPVLSLDPGMFFSSWRVLLDGRVIASRGFSGKGVRHCRMRLRPMPVYFKLFAPRHVLELQVAFRDRLGGGKPGPLFLRTAGAMFAVRSSVIALKLFLGGAFALFAFYHIGIFIFQRRYRSFLWLGLFSIVLLLRSLMEDEYFLLQLIGGMRSDWYYRILYLTLHLAFPLYTAFFNHLYPTPKLNYLIHFFYGFACVSFVVSFFIHYVDLFIVNHVFFFAVAGALLFFLSRTWLEVRRKTPGSLLFFSGVLLLSGFVVHDMLAIAGSFSAPRHLYFGLLLFVIVQAVLLARGYSRAVAGLREILDRPDELRAAFDRFGLSEREREVSLLLVKGKKYREIGDELYISIKTVKFHCANIYRKCRARNRTEFLNRMLQR